MENQSPSRTTVSGPLNWSTWGQEWWAMLGAFSVFIVLAIVLDNYDGEPVFSWNGVTLNTISSILSVTIKAAVLFVVAECMAQWKWILFAQEQRPLIDFDRLDAASRGPMGSLRLLLRTNGAFVARFGAVLTLAALALDPFAQQLVQLREVTNFRLGKLGSDAFVVKAQAYSSGSMPDTGADFRWNNETAELEQYVVYPRNVTTSASVTMSAAISGGFIKTLKAVHRERLFNCPTGNCTFDPFLTLGICHKSRNITSKLTRSNEDQNFNNTLEAFGKGSFPSSEVRLEDGHASAFVLPNGHFIANIDGTDPTTTCENCISYLATSFGTENPNKTVSMRDLDTLVWSMSIIFLDIIAHNNSKLRGDDGVWPNIPIVASESALYYCVKNITASVVNHKFHEEVTEVSGVTRTNNSWDAGLRSRKGGLCHAPPDEARALAFQDGLSLQHYNDLRLQVPGQNATFSVTPSAMMGLSAHFQELFRWPDWHNSVKVREQLEGVPGMAKAVAYNAAYFGPHDNRWTYREAQPLNLLQLMSKQSFFMYRQATVFEVMAESMTNELRSFTGDKTRHISDTKLELGHEGVQMVLYRVEWPWIGLHATVLGSACLFMILTIQSSGRSDGIPLWKSSSLGAIRRGHDIGDKLASAGDQIADMEAMARKLKVKAFRDDVDEASPTLSR